MFRSRGRSAQPQSSKDARATANGDAIWLVQPVEYIPTPPEKSFTQLVPYDKQLDLVGRALKSFGETD